MMPETPEQMEWLLTMALVTRLYGDATSAARRKRLTEHDISLLEDRIIRDFAAGPDFAQEFQTFQAEIPRAAALKTIKEMCAVIRADRQKKIAQER